MAESKRDSEKNIGRDIWQGVFEPNDKRRIDFIPLELCICFDDLERLEALTKILRSFPDRNTFPELEQRIDELIQEEKRKDRSPSNHIPLFRRR